MRQQIFLNWQAANTFGWGLLGMGIALHWASDPDIQALMGFPMGPDDFPGMDTIRAMALSAVVPASNHFLGELSAGAVDLRERRIVVMDAIGNGFSGPNLNHHGIHNIGRCVFEDTRMAFAATRLAKYDSLLCASDWNAALLRAATDKPVTVIHEGIDESQFFPGPRSGLLDPGRFYIFSGGKIEYRKAQDLVLLAFREFASRHDDAVLVAAWHSHWPNASVGFQGKLAVPLGRNSQGGLDFSTWVARNGVRPEQFLELPPMPNSMLPAVLREMDCAMQVSRCEPCTNLPAKEAMACGVPVIVSDNSGTRDLIAPDNCIPMRSQGAVRGQALGETEGWGESSVEEIVASLEALYTDSTRRAQVGARAAAWILEQRRTWRAHAATLKSHLMGLARQA